MVFIEKNYAGGAFYRYEQAHCLFHGRVKNIEKILKEALVQRELHCNIYTFRE